MVFLLALAVAYGDSQQATSTHKRTKKSKITPSQVVTPQTAQSETVNNTAGSIAGNSGAIGSTPGVSKPQDPSTPQQSEAGQTGGQPLPGSAQAAQNSAGQNASSGIALAPEVDSRTLQGEIDSALKSDPTLSNSQLSVSVNDSQIMLSGSVPTGKEKQTASRIVQSYAGNRRVKEDLNVAGQQKAGSIAQQPNSMSTNSSNPK